MWRLYTLLVVCTCLGACYAAGQAGAASAAATAAAAAPPFARGQVLVRFRQTSAARRLAAAQGASPLAGLALQQYAGKHQALQVPRPGVATVAAAAPTDAVMLFSITDNSTVMQKIAQLRRLPEVEVAEPNLARTPERPTLAGAQRRLLASLSQPCLRSDQPGMVGCEGEDDDAESAAAAAAAGHSRPAGRHLESAQQQQALPNDFYFRNFQWHLHRVAAPLAWATQTGSSQVKVCVIDTGLKADHPEFSDGRVIKGWNRACPTCSSKESPPHNVTKPDPGTPAYFNFTDVGRHGTHVAGIIGAATNNAEGVAGVSWQVSFYICAVESPNGFFYTSSLLDCFALCKEEGARIYSNSYFSDCEGSPPCYSQLEYDAIQDLGQGSNPALFVVAAGNFNQNQDELAVDRRSYPAGYQLPNVLSVASTTSGDVRSDFSNWGPTLVHLAAPGNDVLSSVPSGYAYMSGTSMACPIVAGAAALLWSARPSATVAEVRQALLESVDPLADLAGKVATGGRLNVARALHRLLGAATTPQLLTYGYTVTADTRVSLALPLANCSLTTNATDAGWQACKDRCMDTQWCWYFIHTPTNQSATCNGIAVSGTCLLADSNARMGSPSTLAGATLGYKTILPPPPPSPPLPPPSPPLPSPPPPRPSPPPPSPSPPPPPPSPPPPSPSPPPPSPSPPPPSPSPPPPSPPPPSPSPPPPHPSPPPPSPPSPPNSPSPPPPPPPPPYPSPPPPSPSPPPPAPSPPPPSPPPPHPSPPPPSPSPPPPSPSPPPPNPSPPPPSPSPPPPYPSPPPPSPSPPPPIPSPPPPSPSPPPPHPRPPPPPSPLPPSPRSPTPPRPPPPRPPSPSPSPPPRPPPRPPPPRPARPRPPSLLRRPRARPGRPPSPPPLRRRRP